MPRRIEQLDSLLKREIGAILVRDIELPKGTMVTIVAVVTASDLKNATIHISIFPERERGTVLAVLKKNSQHIIHILRGRLSVHHIPAIAWSLDNTEEKAADVEALLDHVRSLREKNLE